MCGVVWSWICITIRSHTAYTINRTNRCFSACTATRARWASTPCAWKRACRSCRARCVHHRLASLDDVSPPTHPMNDSHTTSTPKKQVPVTGHVTTGGSNTYKIWNGDPHAHILVSATTLSGGAWLTLRRTYSRKPPPPTFINKYTHIHTHTPDADIFVMAETYQNESLVLPSRAQFHWKSSRVGDDVVEVLPSDDHFCFDCSYIVTVEGWSNTSYTRTWNTHRFHTIPSIPFQPIPIPTPTNTHQSPPRSRNSPSCHSQGGGHRPPSSTRARLSTFRLCWAPPPRTCASR